MRLSKIKLSGFKSFVDPTTIHFPSNLMGIVGPNGCGKSNVIDAIRWVLGESSAKTLRGDSMADVIFNGSGNRKPVGQASIELSFDNSDATITGPYAGYSEVAVRRVVSRDGTSQYYLNGSRCRRKDITHLLLGTGLGAHGYSIIEQGTISRLVEAKPEELRAFIEEAAGISKFKERRRETEYRIRHTRENLERLGDLREEIDKRLTSLKRQARAAERYKELKSEQRRVNAELLVLRLNALRNEVLEQERQLKEKRLALAAAETAQQSVDAEIEKRRVELADGNEAFNTVQGAYYRIGADIAALEQQIRHRKAMTQRQRDERADSEQQLAEIAKHIADDEVELEQLDRVLSELNPGLEQAYEQQRDSDYALQQAEQALERCRENSEQSAQQLADAQRTVQVEEARIEQLTAQMQRLERERDEQLAEAETIDVVQLERKLETLVGSEESLKAACSEAVQRLNTTWERIRQLKSSETEVSGDLNRLREQLQNDRGRLSSLEALQDAALGQVSSRVDGWLKSHSIDERARLAQELVVEAGWERAVETVLGGFLQAVSVDDLDRILDGVTELGDDGVTVLEAGARAGRGVDADAETHARLANKVRSPAVAKDLLDGILTAESLAAAISMRGGLRPGQSVITPDGVWIGPGWLRVNSNDDPKVGVLARGEEIEGLRTAINDASLSAEDAATTLADIRRQLEQLEADRVAAQTEAHRRQELYAETKSRLEAQRTQLQQARGRAAALERSVEELGQEQQSLANALNDSRSRLRAAENRKAESQAGRERLERARLEQQEQVAEARMQADEDRERVQEMALKVESRRSSKESASAALQRVQAHRQRLLKRQSELDAQIEASIEPLADEEKQLTARLDQRLAIENDLNEARATVERIDEQLRDAQLRRNERQAAVTEARDEADTVRLAAREAQVRAETVNDQFAETGFDLPTISEGLPDTASAEEWSHSLERIEQRINRLGPINLAAIDEFEEQSERKQYLDEQYKDLTEALETLEGAIRKIDRETRSRFKETFDQANQGLGRLFPRLFGGGHAYLELTGDDLLSSGVTVMARPPGKRISTIHLLSGGEKALTAVALVFSIFELNPAPFCLLDEVDAPLDDANVGRFSDIVKEMSDQVQFVLITHNKTTMESMHQLTGVTMQEPGVSRLVAVDIDEAVQLAAM